MLLSESELNMYNADSVLNEAVLLDESESIVKLPAVPVVENSRIGAAVVSFNDLDSIVEDYGCDYEDAFCAIAEQNELDPESLAVSVEDWKLIETPELAGMVPNIVVKPISENNIVYQAVDYCINEYCNTGDEGYLYSILESKWAAMSTPQKDANGNEYSVTYDYKKGESPDLRGEGGSYVRGGAIIDHPQKGGRISSAINYAKNHKKTLAAGAVGIAGAALAAKKIAALRKQQKKYPGLRGKIQTLINKLKSKLH